jgi:F-type H+-transporting ATPase subunit b
MDAVGINWPGLLTQLISFLILFLLLKKFLYRPVIKMLEDRAEKIKTSLEAADKVKQEAEQTTAANESLMLKAREESQALIFESREQAKKIKESELEKSKLQIEIERKRALDEIRSEEDKIINNIRSEFSGLAISAAEKIIEREVNENNHKEIIQLFLKKAKNIKS